MPRGVAKSYKRFGGKPYKFHGWARNMGLANVEAKRLRDKGYLVRIVELTESIMLYKRLK